jgi:CO dehydrogenase nickel-insertion accessory protein CooC1
MKILVCGKGGSGKSTIAALLAKSVAAKGYKQEDDEIDTKRRTTTYI